MKKVISACASFFLLSLLSAFSLGAFAETQDLTLSQYEGSIAGYTMLPFAEAEASSALTDLGTYFGPHMAIDKDDTRPWVEGITGNGRGEYLLLSFDGEKTIDLLCIRPGFADLYKENSRPSSMEITFSDGSSAVCEIPDYNGNCYFRFSRPVTTSFVKLTILDVYQGRVARDTCIAEVSAYSSGRSTHQQFRLAGEQSGSYRTEYSYTSGTQLSTAITYYNDEIESITTYEYSSAGLLLKTTEYHPMSHMNLCFHYDRAGTRIERDDTGGVGSQANYNDFCEAFEKRNQDGRTLLFSVRPKESRYSDEANYDLAYEYTHDGRISSFSGPRFQADYQYKADGSYTRRVQYAYLNRILVQEYDVEGKLLSSSWFTDGTAQSTITYSYDSKGNTLTIQQDNGNVIFFVNEYDANGLLTAQRELSTSGTEHETVYFYESVL